MGRAPRLLLLALLTLGLQPATALAVDGDGETTFTIPLRANHGLTARLEADDDEIELTLRRGAQQTVYAAEGEVTAEGIAVKFGRLGEFVATYEPFRTLSTHGPNRHCEGEPLTITEGFLRGTLRFRGVRDYVRIEAARAKGTLLLRPKWSCDYPRAGASRARGREVDDDEATLEVVSHRNGIRFAVFGARQEEERPYTLFFAFSNERREGFAVSRLTAVGTRSTGFEFDNRRGTAVVDPPAPFAGSAHYRRRPNARDEWGGPLTAPLLGLGRVRLAGPGFKAWMVPRVPEFE